MNRRSSYFIEETRPLEGRGFIKRETRVLGMLPRVWKSWGDVFPLTREIHVRSIRAPRLGRRLGLETCAAYLCKSLCL